MITRDMTPAEQSIAEQLTENTGAHFLDSGSAYGRHWERNQGVDWLNTPEATFDVRWGYPTISTFHYLAARLDVNRTTRAMGRAFEAYVDEDWTEDNRPMSYGGEQRYLNSAGTMAEFLHNDDRFGTNGESEFAGQGGYTYNDENLLDQDFMWDMFAYGPYDDLYVAISTHNGCDARGGFSNYRFYLLDDWEYFFDYGSASVHYGCNYQRPLIEQIQVDMFTNDVVGPVDPCDWTLDIRNGGEEWYGYVNGQFKELGWNEKMEKTKKHDEDGTYKCPCGKGTLVYEAVSAPNQH